MMQRAVVLMLFVAGFVCSVAPGSAYGMWELPPWILIVPAEDCSAGCWELVGAEYLTEGPSQGLHHVFVRTMDAAGSYIVAPFGMAWDGGQSAAQSKPPPDWGDLAMWDCFFPDRGEVGGYRTWAGVWERNSDVVRGVGLPYCLHESIRLTYQWRNAGEIPTATPLPTATATPLPLLIKVYLPMVRQ